MTPVPVQTFLAWCSWFTFGVALLSTTVPMLIPFGILFTLLGMSPFFSERIVLRFLGAFILLLGIALLYVIQGFRLGDGLPRSCPKPSLWYSGLLVIGWGIGIVFGFRRWRISRTKEPPNT
jgi:hypothetical protein